MADQPQTPDSGAPPAPGGPPGLAGSARKGVARITGRLSRYRDAPVVDVGVTTFELDRDAAGSVLGSAIAFRLFLFFVPFLVLVVGIVGLLSGFVDPASVTKAAGVSGTIKGQINEAFHQPGLARWLAVLLGLTGVLTAGRSLSRVLFAASAAAWRLQTRARAPLRTAGAIAGLICGMALIADLVNRLRASFGLGAATLSFLPALLAYTIAWLVVSMLLPRGTDDPGALLPGSAMVGLTLTLMHAVTELYLPDRFHRASQLYGAIGVTVVTLGWFFILGRAIMVSMEVNAAVYEHYGSVSQVVFSLPGVRVLPRRSARLRRVFDLGEPKGT